MSIHSPWRRERLYVLVGDHQVSTFWVKRDWRGWWRPYRAAHAAIVGGLSSTALVEALRDTLKGRALARNCGIYWFLPPDVLAVAMVAKSPSNPNGQLSLPFSQGQTLSRPWNHAEQAQAWLWAHNGWVDLFRQVAEAVGAQTLYLLPRAALLGQKLSPNESYSSPARVHLVRDGAYVHMYVDGACLRSFSVADDHQGEATDAPSREQEELAALAAVFGLSDVSPRDINRVSANADGFLADDLPKMDSDALHRSGLLMHSLADVAERRIQIRAAILSALLLLGGGAAMLHQKDIESANHSMRRELRELLPKVNAARELKEDVARQSAFLAEMRGLNESPDALRLLGHLANSTPRHLTLGDMELSPNTATVAFAAQDVRKFKPTIETEDPVFPMFTAKPEADAKQSDTKSVVRTYVAHVKKDAL